MCVGCVNISSLRDLNLEGKEGNEGSDQSEDGGNRSGSVFFSNDVDFRARVISTPGPDDGLLAGSSSNGDNDAGGLNDRRGEGINFEIIYRY